MMNEAHNDRADVMFHDAGFVASSSLTSRTKVCGEARLEIEPLEQVTPSQAVLGLAHHARGRTEGVEATTVTPKNNPSQERPASSLTYGSADEDMVRSRNESRGEGFNGPRKQNERNCLKSWGNLALTNLQVAGQLASDQTYVILALRSYLFFNGTNARANYVNVASQLYFTLIVGEKPQFSAGAWYLPAGGGIWGFDSTTPVFSNGEPSQEAILTWGSLVSTRSFN